MARGREVKIKPVDDGIIDHPARGHMEALFDQKLFARTIRQERASAYWFAATLWGVSGLVIGGFMGALLSMQVSQASAPIQQDALARGIALESARSRAESHQPLDLTNPDGSQQTQQSNEQPQRH